MLDPIVTADPAAIVPTSSEVAELDLRGLRCPLPVLHTRKALLALSPGRLLRVLATDPLAGLDIPHLLRETGDMLIAEERLGACQAFTICKANNKLR